MIIQYPVKEIKHSNHSVKRASQRGITDKQVELCIMFGEEYNKTGVIFYFMSKNCLKKLKKAIGVYAQELDGLVVLGEMDSQNKFNLITVYKNKNALSIIKHKEKFNRNRS
ncbi:DUF4258 domain-containing protein [Candidatus Neomarinimicrobiota bacterium]